MGCPVFLNDSGQGSQRFIDCTGAGKHGGYIRLKHHDVAARRVAGRELIGLRTTEIILRKNLVYINFARLYFSGFVLHSISVLAELPRVH
jgi:hypothetical protein